jgi:hypothetical protein
MCHSAASMFLRSTNRKKDGQNHRYFRIVENRRLSSGKTAVCSQKRLPRRIKFRGLLQMLAGRMHKDVLFAERTVPAAKAFLLTWRS